MKSKKIVFYIALLLSFFTTQAKAQVNFENLAQSMQKEKRNIVMFISSQHCVYCLMQEKKLKKTNNLNGRLDNEVYFLPWMAEKQGKLVFNEKTYDSGMDFAKSFTKDGLVGFPFWIIFDKNYQPIYTYSGLIPVEKLNEILDILANANHQQK